MKILTKYLNWEEANAIAPFADYFQSDIAEVNTLINDYIATGNAYIVRVRKPVISVFDGDFTDEEIKTAINETWRAVKLFLTKTTPAYSTLIKLYEANADKLIDSLNDDVTTTGTSQSTDDSQNTRVESDTPISATLADFENGGNNNLSFGSQDRSKGTATNTENGTSKRSYDTSYLIDKLDKARQKYLNLYTRWYADFYKEFAAANAECSI